MPQSICKGGNQSSHSPWTSKVASLVLIPTTHLNTFPSRAVSGLAAQDGIDQSQIQQELGDKSRWFTETTPSRRGSSHLPAQQRDSQDLPTHLSVAMPLLPVRVGEYRRCWRDSNFLMLTSVPPHRDSLNSWFTTCHQVLLLTGH